MSDTPVRKGTRKKVKLKVLPRNLTMTDQQRSEGWLRDKLYLYHKWLEYRVKYGEINDEKEIELEKRKIDELFHMAMRLPEFEAETMNRGECARELEVCTRTLDSWHLQRKGPPRAKFGKHVIYWRHDVIAWRRVNG